MDKQMQKPLMNASSEKDLPSSSERKDSTSSFEKKDPNTNPPGGADKSVFEPTVDTVPKGGRVRIYTLTADQIPIISQHSTGTEPVFLKCSVCNSDVNIKGKERQFVVKCDNCSEATPIRAPPADKKYVRCVCKCLLISRKGALRIVCPRDDCHRILILSPTDKYSQSVQTAEGEDLQGSARVICPYCGRNFFFDVRKNKIAKCPLCARRCAASRQRMKYCAIGHLILFLLLLLVLVLFINFTHHMTKDYVSLYAGYVCMSILSILVIVRAYYLYKLPIGMVVVPAT